MFENGYGYKNVDRRAFEKISALCDKGAGTHYFGWVLIYYKGDNVSGDIKIMIDSKCPKDIYKEMIVEFAKIVAETK